MQLAKLFSSLVSVAVIIFSTAQVSITSNAEGDSCSSAAKEIEAIIQRDQQAQGFSLRIALLPSLQEALISLQVSASSAKAPAVQQMQFCEITPSMFHISDGHVTGTTVTVDREPPTWLIGLASDGKKYLLAGFTDPLKGFNDLIEAVGLQVGNADLVPDVFDFYLRLTGREALRESIVVDEMQLQSEGLEDFRLRYSFRQARSMYAKWWSGIPPMVKKKLHRPSVIVEHNGFRVSYFRYSHGRVLQESVIVSKQGAVTAGASTSIYAFDVQ